MVEGNLVNVGNNWEVIKNVIDVDDLCVVGEIMKIYGIKMNIIMLSGWSLLVCSSCCCCCCGSWSNFNFGYFSIFWNIIYCRFIFLIVLFFFW